MTWKLHCNGTTMLDTSYYAENHLGFISTASLYGIRCLSYDFMVLT